MMFLRMMLVVALAAPVMGCLDFPADGEHPDELLEEAVVMATEQPIAVATRPSLASICGYRCNDSHFGSDCYDQRSSGQVNISVFPLLEGKTKTPSPIIGINAGWNQTSCPNCLWQLNDVSTNWKFPASASGPTVAQATNDVNVSKFITAGRLYEWDGVVSITIWDPTDGSVGTCVLNVGTSLYGPML
jgi:hypothetical protein